MRLVIQGFFGRRHKRILEMTEIIVIVVLLTGGILFAEAKKEKETETSTVKQMLEEGMEESFLSYFFPVLSRKAHREDMKEGEIFLKTMISYISPLYQYTGQSQDAAVSSFLKNEDVLQEERKAYVIEDVSEDMLNLLQTENSFHTTNDLEFVKNIEKSVLYNWEEYTDFDDFIRSFYTVDSVTVAKESYFQLEKLLGMDMTLKQGNDKPQILIYHTHSQEAFSDSVSGNRDSTIVGAGDMLTQILQDEYGYNVIHHTGEYDVPSRDYAYSKSLPALEKLLEENPTIEVVIDLHRDGVNENTRLVTDIQGKQTAKFMFFNGLSTTKKGPISYLENPNLQENLAFSFQMQVAANEYYPGIARKNYLNAYRYNMHLRGKTLLVELGAQTNTVEEIKNAIAPLAHILDIVLSGEK